MACCLLPCICCGAGCLAWAIHRTSITGALASESWPTAHSVELEDFPRLAAIVLAAYEPDLALAKRLLAASLDDEGRLNAARADLKKEGGGEETLSLRRTSSLADGKGDRVGGAKGGGKDGTGEGKERQEKDRLKDQWVDQALVYRADYVDTEGNCPAYIILVDDRRKDITVALRGLNLVKASDYLILQRNHKGKQMFDGGYVHFGLLRAAGWLLDNETDRLRRLLRRHPSYTLTLTGHSLGGGIGALASLLVLKNLAAFGPDMTAARLRCVSFAPPRCMSLNLAVRHADVITSVVVQDDFLPRMSQPLLTIFSAYFCLPCLLQYACCLDTFQSEKRRIEDPRRLYAPGRLYHILYTKPWSCQDHPPTVKTAVPVDKRFENVVLSRTAHSDHLLTTVVAKVDQAFEALQDQEEEAMKQPAVVAPPPTQAMVREEGKKAAAKAEAGAPAVAAAVSGAVKTHDERVDEVRRSHRVEHLRSLEKAVSLRVPNAVEPSAVLVQQEKEEQEEEKRRGRMEAHRGGTEAAEVGEEERGDDREATGEQKPEEEGKALKKSVVMDKWLDLIERLMEDEEDKQHDGNSSARQGTQSGPLPVARRWQSAARAALSQESVKKTSQK